MDVKKEEGEKGKEKEDDECVIISTQKVTNMPFCEVRTTFNLLNYTYRR